jgi:hypothetical protein
MDYTITIHKRLSTVMRNGTSTKLRYVYDFSLKVDGRQFWEHGLGYNTRYKAYRRAKTCLKIFYNTKSRFYTFGLKFNPLLQ